MEILRDNEAQLMCPYNPSHYIRKSRMEYHLVKCRKSFPQNGRFVMCDFNSTHRIPMPEIQYHHETCPDRKKIEVEIYQEEAKDPPIQIPLPNLPVPVDSSWDDEDVPTYDPQKYCEKNKILRRLDTASAAKRRDFRLAERERFNQFDDIVEKKSDTARNTRTETEVLLPPTPAFAQPSLDTPPENINKLKERISKVSTVVIPKM
ncbi:hypothetical protein ABEB36_005343 [Hypothenemus hampei]|uniref:CHHC U11-48K-type domain-containing protein n=1 Tax=Hypothenemus hampei TaxID=57062 RepID=A0ABD1F1R9_HYPHA